MDIDLADREAATEPTDPDSPDCADETEESPRELPMADCWAIEGSESGA